MKTFDYSDDEFEEVPSLLENSVETQETTENEPARKRKRAAGKCWKKTAVYDTPEEAVASMLEVSFEHHYRFFLHLIRHISVVITCTKCTIIC
jgi:hypothetical protein